MTARGSADVELVRAWMRACNDSDVEGAVALCEEAFEMTESATLPGAATTTGHDALRRYMRGWTRNWSEWRWQEEEVIELPPDHVLVMANLWMRGLRGGVGVSRRWAYLFTVRDGRLLRQDGYDDKAAALAAAGLAEPSPTENVQTMRAAIEAFNRRDGQGFGATLADDAEIAPVRAALEGTVYRGPDAAAQYCAAVDESWEDLRWEIEEIRDGGDWVLALGHIRGRGRGSGAPMDARAGWVAHFREGLITSFRTCADRADALAAVGLRE